jgi:cell division protein FtsL
MVCQIFDLAYFGSEPLYIYICIFLTALYTYILLPAKTYTFVCYHLETVVIRHQARQEASGQQGAYVERRGVHAHETKRGRCTQ